MKKLLITILIIFSGLSAYGQTYETQGFAAGDPDVAGSNVAIFDSITAVGAVLHYYVDGVEVASIDTTKLDARITANTDALADVVEASTITAGLDEIIQSDSLTFVNNRFAVWQGSTQRYAAGAPYVYVVAGDTSNVSVPGAVGDLFFDTSNSIIYGAISTTVGGWLRISNVP